MYGPPLHARRILPLLAMRTKPHGSRSGGGAASSAFFLYSQCGLSRTAAGREVALRRGTYLRTAESVSSCPIVEFARIATVMPTYHNQSQARAGSRPAMP